MTLFGDRKFRVSWRYLCAKPQAYHLSVEILWLVINVLCSLLENCHSRGNIAWAFEAAAHQLISASLAGRFPPVRRVKVTFPSMSLCLDTPWSNVPAGSGCDTDGAETPYQPCVLLSVLPFPSSALSSLHPACLGGSWLPPMPPLLPGSRSPSPSSPLSAPPTPPLCTSLGSVCANISISADCKDWFNFMGVISFKKSLSEQQPNECLIKHIFLQ